MKKTINKEERPHGGIFEVIVSELTSFVLEKYNEMELSPAEVIGAMEATKYIVGREIERLMDEEDARGYQ